MGKGALTSRVHTVGAVNISAAGVLSLYAVLGLSAGARAFTLVLAGIAVVLGVAQVLHRPTTGTANRRATPEELRAALWGPSPPPE